MDRTRRILVPVVAMLGTALAGCERPGGAETTAPVALVEIGPGQPLAAALAELRLQLDSAAAAGAEDASARHLDRAEAISDRLLEARLPFAWLSAQSYSLEARLRQIQTRIDRAESLLTGGRRDELLVELGALRDAVASLESDLGRGGTAAPPPVAQLLVTLDTTRRR